MCVCSVVALPGISRVACVCACMHAVPGLVVVSRCYSEPAVCIVTPGGGVPTPTLPGLVMTDTCTLQLKIMLHVMF